MKFDVILANPPYDNGLHEKFSIKYFDICDGEICWVSPLSFLLGKRQNKKLTVHLDKYATDIEQINGNEYFDAAIGGTMGIVYVDMSDKYLHYVKFDGKEYKECSEISNLDRVFESFKNKVKCDKLTDSLQNHLKAQPNKNYLQNIIETKPNDNWWCVGIVSMHAPLKSDGSHGDSWYAMISKNKLDEYHCQYKDLKRKVRTDKNGNTWKPAIAFGRNYSVNILALYVNQSDDYAQFDEDSRLLIKMENDSVFKFHIILDYGVEKNFETSYNRYIGRVDEYSTYTCYEVSDDFIKLINDGKLIKKIRIVFTNGTVADYDIDNGYMKKLTKGLQESYIKMEEKQKQKRKNMNDEDF